MRNVLVIREFDFPPIALECAKSIYLLQDSDRVLLEQRKNQLSRRLREAEIVQSKQEQNNKRKEEGSDTLISSAHGAGRDTSIQNSASDKRS